MICSVQREFQLPPYISRQRIPHHQQPRTYTGQKIFHSYVNDGFFRQCGCTEILFCSTMPPSWNIRSRVIWSFRCHAMRCVTFRKTPPAPLLDLSELLFTYGFLACFEEKMRDNPDLSSYMTWYPVFPWKILQRGLVDDENVRQEVVLRTFAPKSSHA